MELLLLPLELLEPVLLLGKLVVLTEMIEPLDAVTVVVTLPSGLVTTDVVSAEELELELLFELEGPLVADPPKVEDVPVAACTLGGGAARLFAETPEVFMSHLPLQ